MGKTLVRAIRRASPVAGTPEELGKIKSRTAKAVLLVVGRNYFRLKKAFMPGY